MYSFVYEYLNPMSRQYNYNHLHTCNYLPTYARYICTSTILVGEQLTTVFYVFVYLHNVPRACPKVLGQGKCIHPFTQSMKHSANMDSSGREEKDTPLLLPYRTSPTRFC